MTGFRSMRGVQGQTAGTRRCQVALQRHHEAFKPQGLAEFLEAEKTQTTNQALASILNIETMLQKTILEELKGEFGADENDWWYKGVPKTIRKKVDDQRNEDAGKRGQREHYFDLIDYRAITLTNWGLFEGIFADGKGNKDARTKWIVSVNEIRRTAAHASRGVHLPVTAEQLAFLHEREGWLKDKIAARGD